MHITTWDYAVYDHRKVICVGCILKVALGSQENKKLTRIIKPILSIIKNKKMAFSAWSPKLKLNPTRGDRR